MCSCDNLVLVAVFAVRHNDNFAAGSQNESALLDEFAVSVSRVGLVSVVECMAVIFIAIGVDTIMSSSGFRDLACEVRLEFGGPSATQTDTR